MDIFVDLQYGNFKIGSFNHLLWNTTRKLRIILCEGRDPDVVSNPNKLKGGFSSVAAPPYSVSELEFYGLPGGQTEYYHPILLEFITSSTHLEDL